MVSGDYLNFEWQFQARDFSHIQIHVPNAVTFFSHEGLSAHWRLAISLLGCQQQAPSFWPCGSEPRFIFPASDRDTFVQHLAELQILFSGTLAPSTSAAGR